MIEMLKLLIAHAVGLHGRNRIYNVSFGASTPIVRVYSDGYLLAEFWAVNDVIQERSWNPAIK